MPVKQPEHRYTVHWRVWGVGLVKRRFIILADALAFGSVAIEHASDHRAFLTSLMTGELLEKDKCLDWHATIGILMPDDVLDVTNKPVPSLDAYALQRAGFTKGATNAGTDTKAKA